IEGFMPLGRQHGFIFTSVTNGAEENKESITQVIAHELGHGVFGLEHPFTQLKTAESTTNWLMDYASGNTFNHMEWAKIHNPDFDIYRFQKDEEGEKNDIAYRCISSQLSKPNPIEHYYTNNEEIVKLNEKYVPVAFVGTSDP